MVGYLCSSLAILVFWGLVHFQDAAVLMADRPLTYLQAKPFTVVNNDETHSLHREKEPKESRLKRQSGENNESNKIMETLTSLVNAIKEQIDERERADGEQSGISDSLRNDLTKWKEDIGRLRDELTSNITSLQDGLELHVIEYENRTSEIIRLGEKLENEESNCKKKALNVSLLQEQMDDQHSANISHIETELEKLTRANENITSDIDDLREEFASRTADVRNNLTLAVGSLWERLDLKENTDGILVTNVTSLHERIELQEHTDDQLSSYLIRLQVRLNNQEYADTNLTSNLSSMQRKIDQQEDTDTRLTSNMTRLQERLNHQENKDTFITSNLTSMQAILGSYLTGLQEKLTSDIANLLTRLERLENTKLQTDALKKSLHQAESKWASDLKELGKRIEFAPLCLGYKFQTSYYYLVWQRLTWKHAEENCKSLGGNLAEVESSAEHNYLKGMRFGDEVWLGGTDQESEGIWKWQGSGRFIQAQDYSAGSLWGRGQPDNHYNGTEDCMALQWPHDYRWNDRPCTDKIASLCEISVQWPDNKRSEDRPVLIFRALAGVNVSAYDTYVNKSGNGRCDQALTTDCLSADDPSLPLDAHYRCGLLDQWSSLSIDMVHVSVYKEEKEVAVVTFNGTGSTYLNWFSPDRVINSSWTEVIPQSQYSSIFSLEGPGANFHRRFYIPYSHFIGCDIVAGWLVVAETPARVSECTWERGEYYPRIYYSKLSTYATWSSASDVGMADMLTVSVTLRKR